MRKMMVVVFLWAVMGAGMISTRGCALSAHACDNLSQTKSITDTD